MTESVRSLKSMMPSERAEWLLGAPEDQWFDRKSAKVKPEVLARTLIGMANAEGGLVVLGISDGAFEDLSAIPQRVNELRRTPMTHCAPPPRVTFSELAVLHQGGEGSVLVARVEPGETLHETTGGDCYLRVGDSTMRLAPTQREELAYDRGAAQFEARSVAGVTVEHLSIDRIRELGRVTGSGPEVNRILAARNLVSVGGGVTVAGCLLLADHPQAHFPNAHVRVTRFLESERGTGRRQSAAEGEDDRYEGPIADVIESATAAVQRMVPRRTALRADGKFGPVEIIPRDVWLEGLVNAVVHRSYSMVGDHVRVDVFPDRIEIESPGRFPGIVDPDRPLEITRYARNPRIARVCHDLGITQERGEGVRRMFEEMRSVGLVDPVYRQTSGSVRLTLFGVSRVSQSVAEGLPSGADAALQILRLQGEPMGTGDIQEAIGLARPATLRALKALRDLGEIEWRGKSSRDPRATWRIAH